MSPKVYYIRPQLCTNLLRVSDIRNKRNGRQPNGSASAVKSPMYKCQLGQIKDNAIGIVNRYIGRLNKMVVVALISAPEVEDLVDGIFVDL